MKFLRLLVIALFVGAVGGAKGMMDDTATAVESEVPSGISSGIPDDLLRTRDLVGDVSPEGELSVKAESPRVLKRKPLHLRTSSLGSEGRPGWNSSSHVGQRWAGESFEKKKRGRGFARTPSTGSLYEGRTKGRLSRTPSISSVGSTASARESVRILSDDKIKDIIRRHLERGRTFLNLDGLKEVVNRANLTKVLNLAVYDKEFNPGRKSKVKGISFRNTRLSLRLAIESGLINLLRARRLTSIDIRDTTLNSEIQRYIEKLNAQRKEAEIREVSDRWERQLNLWARQDLVSELATHHRGETMEEEATARLVEGFMSKSIKYYRDLNSKEMAADIEKAGKAADREAKHLVKGYESDRQSAVSGVIKCVDTLLRFIDAAIADGTSFERYLRSDAGDFSPQRPLPYSGESWVSSGLGEREFGDAAPMATEDPLVRALVLLKERLLALAERLVGSSEVEVPGSSGLDSSERIDAGDLLEVERTVEDLSSRGEE